MSTWTYRPIEQAAPFGAQQAIIVRSESTAKSLTTRLQKRCTVLSLLETKGNYRFTKPERLDS